MKRGVFFVMLLAALSCADRAPSPGVLYDFETEADLDRIVWHCRCNYTIVPEHATSGSHSLRCDFGDVLYPSLTFHDFPTDMSRFGSITMDLFNENDEPLHLVVRVDDEESGEALENRYNGSFMLDPGPNRVMIPIESVRGGPAKRSLDLSHITRFFVFLVHAPTPVTFYVDSIELR